MLEGFVPRMGRSVTTGQFVEVYRNLHKGGWSIRDQRSGLVVGHARAVGLRRVEFVVSAAGRDRVRREGVKHVHAWVRGDVADDVAGGSVEVRYNPHKDEGFTANGRVVRFARSAFLGDGATAVLAEGVA